MCHDVLRTKGRESEKKNTCARREKESKKFFDRKKFSTCIEMPFEFCENLTNKHERKCSISDVETAKIQ